MYCPECEAPEMNGILNSASPVLAQRPSFLKRIAGKLFPMPQIDGLLSPEDQKAAQMQGLLSIGSSLSQAGGYHPQGTAPGFMQSVGAAIQAGQGSAQQFANQAISRQGQSVDMAAKRQDMVAQQQQMKAQQDALAKKSRLETERQAYFARNPLPDNATQTQQTEAFRKAAGFFYQNGDTEMLPNVLDYLKSQKPGQPIEVDAGDRTVFLDPDTHQPIPGMEVKHGIKPIDSTAKYLAAEAKRTAQASAGENRLYGQYQKDAKNIADAATMYQTIQSSAAQAKTNPTSQVGMIYAFMKMLDPGSTVREGEYATASNTAGVPDRIRNLFNRAKDGKFLTNDQVDNFVATSHDLARGYKARQANFIKSYTAKAQRQKLTPENTYMDYFDGLDIPSGTPTPTGRFSPLDFPKR